MRSFTNTHTHTCCSSPSFFLWANYVFFPFVLGRMSSVDFIAWKFSSTRQPPFPLLSPFFPCFCWSTFKNRSILTRGWRRLLFNNRIFFLMLIGHTHTHTHKLCYIKKHLIKLNCIQFHLIYSQSLMRFSVTSLEALSHFVFYLFFLCFHTSFVFN